MGRDRGRSLGGVLSGLHDQKAISSSDRHVLLANGDWSWSPASDPRIEGVEVSWRLKSRVSLELCMVVQLLKLHSQWHELQPVPAPVALSRLID